jgi:hypothetical protein
MNATNQSIGEDLAFLRALAEGGGESQWVLGASLLAGGALYGLECFVHGAQGVGWLVLSEAVSVSFAAAITIGFLTVLGWIMWRHRGARANGVAARALAAAFSAAGAATLAMLCVFATLALREQSLMIWMLYPCTVFALQGAAWMVAWMMRRRAWLGVVAFGWLGSAIALSLAIGHELYSFVAGLALVLFMAIPGAVMMRPAQP